MYAISEDNVLVDFRIKREFEKGLWTLTLGAALQEKTKPSQDRTRESRVTEG